MTDPLITATDMAEFREMAEGVMFDTCTITRVTGTETDDDGAIIPTRVTVYEGKCKIQSTVPQESNPEAGGHTFTTDRLRLDLPVARTADDYKPQIGDLATITAAMFDPHLIGAELRVVALLHKSMATAYRLATTNEEA